MYPQPISDTDYKRLTWNVLFGEGEPGVNEQIMFDKECAVAARILDWLTAHPECSHYRPLIQAVPFQTYLQPDRSDRLRQNLWMRTNASLWISPRDATSHTCVLWQLAIVRLSRYLNTGQWEEIPASTQKGQ